MNSVSRQQILSVLNHSHLELSQFDFSDELILRIQEFCGLLHKWNGKINLTSEKTPLSILEKHIFDSLHYLRWVEPDHRTLDIGSGGGFPGIPIKIFVPELEIILLDSQRKRCNFLREVIRHLKLDKISVVEGRVEGFSSRDDFADCFDRVLFRGFSSYQTCLDTGLPFLNDGGRIILQKGPDEMADFKENTPPNASPVESREVFGFSGKSSMMMVIEKCST